jgi:2-polyprenyl-3-methyl-5-hydroxy-6-metoxy-1,4-benzoquinol methylase
MENLFDTVAKTWDQDPAKIKRAQLLAIEIKELIKGRETKKALEFGCGTGILSFWLKNFFQHVTLVDNSVGMIDVLKEKVSSNGTKHFNPVLVDIENENFEGKFDVVYSIMALHHVGNVESVIQKLSGLLVPGGMLIIADLVEEDGTFHTDPEENKMVHKGFNRDYISGLFSKNGMLSGTYKIFTSIEKEREGVSRAYPLFLCSGIKS